jgi:DNA-binding transcriptional LysR family regulator
MNAGGDWQDLELLMALVEAGSFAGAASALRVDATTISRRLARLEGRIGSRAFDRVDGSLVPTPVLEEALGQLRAMRTAAAAAEDALRRGKAELSGRVRVSSLGFIFQHWLAPRLGDFHRRHPMVALDWVAEDRSASFARREADIAVRLGRPEDDVARMRRLGAISFRLYRHASAAEATAPPILSYGEDLDHLPEMVFLRSMRAGRRPVLRANRIDMLTAASAAIGAELLLPEQVAASFASLRPAPDVEGSVSREAFMLLHPERMETASVRAVADWVVACF